MPITDDIKKTLSDPTPLYALAGAGDLAYEKLREVPGKVEALAADRKAAQEKAAARLQEAQSLLVEAQGKVTEAVTALPAELKDLKELQEKAQTFALQQVGRAAEFAVKAKEAYDELAERGKAVVEKNRGGSAEPAGEVAAEAEVTEVALDAEPAQVEPAEESTQNGAAASASTAKKATRARKSTGK
ncbi:hypothetical protein [Kitasatospora sp. DSM 101779]|uniref:hypothetical protein n=1 Tax=Kitasatospora sp. DSM 101779 TaxID=2853165 RepID=UPI0021DB268E|nr:hypothetical protein [Kitasatospora sp. DSM 101779]MCU7824051.1 hypothetical protein [Kitasatospora sp. DSM 101779]